MSENKQCEKCGRLVPEGRECPTCSGWGASEWFVFVATMAVTLGIIAVGWQPAKKAETVKSPNGGVIECYPGQVRPDGAEIDACVDGRWQKLISGGGAVTVKKAAKKIQTGAPRVENLTDWGINHDDERVSPITAQLKEIDHRCIGPFTPDGNMTFVDCPEQIIMIEGDKCRVVMVPKAEGKP